MSKCEQQLWNVLTELPKNYHNVLLIPPRAIVIKHSILNLALPPWIPNFAQINAAASNIFVGFNDTVGVIRHESTIGAITGAPGSDNIVHLVPGHHFIKEFVLGNFGTHSASATHFGPFHFPRNLFGIMKVIVLGFPMPFMRIIFAEALEFALVGIFARNMILMFAPRQDTPGVIAIAADNFIPSATVNGKGLFQIATPQFSVCRGFGGQNLARADIVGGCEAFVNYNVDFFPMFNVP